MIEYIVIGGVNNSTSDAHLLGKLLAGRNVFINLIPYNPTDVAANFVPPTNESLNEFEQIIKHEYNLLVTIRRTMGQDIDGACGQLVVKKNQSACSDDCSSDSPKKNNISDIEDLAKPKAKIKTPKIKSTKKSIPKKQPNYYLLMLWIFAITVC